MEEFPLQHGEILVSDYGYKVQVVWLSEMVADLMGEPDHH